MKKITLHTLVIVALSLAATFAFADRGGFGRKDKKRVVLDIANAANLKYSILTNLRAGFIYKGSLSLNQYKTNSAVISNSIMSFKKGNTMYILPYKQKVMIPEYNRTTGYKVIIRSK